MIYMTQQDFQQIEDLLNELNRISMRVCTYEFGLPLHDDIFIEDARRLLVEFRNKPIDKP